MFSRFRRNSQLEEGTGTDEDVSSTPTAAVALAETVAVAEAAAAAASEPTTTTTTTVAPVNNDNNDNSFTTTGPEDDDDVDETNKARDDLEAQVRARDARISNLEKTRADKAAQLAELQKELEQERLMQMKASILHRIETERLERQTKAVEDRLAALERDMRDTDAIAEYANLIKGVAPKTGSGGAVDSQYVMKLQSQLAKAVKKMDATAHQMAQVEQSCDDVVASLQSEIAEIVEDRCRTELELRKQLELLEEQKAEMQAEYDDRIRDNQREIDRLQQKKSAADQQRKQKSSSDIHDPQSASIADLERQLEETEAKLEQLNNIHEMQERTISELNQTLEGTDEGGAAVNE